MEPQDPALSRTPIDDANAEKTSQQPDSQHPDIENHTNHNKGTDTFEEDVVDSKHVNDDDNPARQPDRRDQQGSSPFDENINDDTMGSEAPKSEGITDMNRYATIDNAQTRVLNSDEKD